jgi:iron-sulfur cluster insertion protein
VGKEESAFMVKLWQILKRRNMITLTANAEQRIKQLLSEYGEGATGVRVSVAGGGCSGFQYGMSFDMEQPGDFIQTTNDLNVYINAESAPLLEGLHIDYLDTLEQSGFSITNPNAKSSCGCGKSFSA